MSGDGRIELKRSVDSIVIGHRHRTDLGDLDALAASIDRDGLLQPPTITPDGVLVCGRRRLAAIQQLGWRTVNVWVRSGISDRLGHLLAEQDDNVLHKPLTPLEATTLYRELKELLAEDAAARQAATRFSSGYQPGATGEPADSDGGGKFPAPSTPSGETRQQAAAMIPGAGSYKTLDKIEYVQQAAMREDLSAEARAEIAQGLAEIEAGGPVHPVFTRVRELLADAPGAVDLEAMAQEALARAKQAGSKTKRRTPAVAATPVWTTRSFVVIWSELDGWWTHYDPDTLADALAAGEVEMFLTIADGTSEFAAALEAARARQETAEDGDGAVEPVRHLRAL